MLGCGTPGEYPNCSTEDFAQHSMCQGFKNWSKLAALSVEQFLDWFLEARLRPSLVKGRCVPWVFSVVFLYLSVGSVCAEVPRFTGQSCRPSPCPATSAGLPESTIRSLPFATSGLLSISGASFLSLFSELLHENVRIE